MAMGGTGAIRRGRTSTREAFEEQNALGRKQAVRGQLGTKWRKALEPYYLQRYGEEKDPAKLAVKACLDMKCNLWVRRNEFIYEKTVAESV